MFVVAIAVIFPAGMTAISWCFMPWMSVGVSPVGNSWVVMCPAPRFCNDNPGSWCPYYHAFCPLLVIVVSVSLLGTGFLQKSQTQYGNQDADNHSFLLHGFSVLVNVAMVDAIQRLEFKSDAVKAGKLLLSLFFGYRL